MRYTVAMRNTLLWALAVGICSLVLAAVLQAPQWRHLQSPLHKGVAVSLNSDEPIYLARVQESLSGRPEQTAEAFTGHPNLQGTQFAMLERFYGTVFRFTGWRAQQVLTALDVMVPVAVFLSLLWVLVLCGFDRKTALILSLVFCGLQLYNLNRPIHMRSSFLVMLWAVGLVQAAVVRRRWLLFPAAVLLGVLVGVYVWSFMFAWAVWGVYFAWEFGEWLHKRWQDHRKTHRSKMKRWLHRAGRLLWYVRPRKPSWQAEPWHTLGLAGVVGLVVAIPFIAKYLALRLHPLYEYGEFRSGMHPGRMPESLPYSLLFAFAAASFLVALYKRYDSYRPYRFVFVLLFAACVYMNQQIFHGITFNFVSHGIFSLLLAAVAGVGLAVIHNDWWLRAGSVFLTVYLLAVGYDGRYVLNQWRVDEGSFANQHLAEALPALDALPRGRFVSDPDTLAFLAGSTHHDVVYSVYLKNVLMSHSELAMRYCLTQLPLHPTDWVIENRQHLVMPDAVSAFGQAVRRQEVAMVRAACNEAASDPALSLQTHEVSHVFWNKRNAPNWNLGRLQVGLEEVASGENWMLYRILP